MAGSHSNSEPHRELQLLMFRGWEEHTGEGVNEVCATLEDGQQRLLSDADGPWTSDNGEMVKAEGVVGCGWWWEVCCKGLHLHPSS